jgi:hypothetical protein
MKRCDNSRRDDGEVVDVVAVLEQALWALVWFKLCYSSPPSTEQTEIDGRLVRIRIPRALG